MRRAVLLMAAFLILVLLAPTAGATTGPVPRPAGVDPTVVQPVVPTNIVAGEQTALVAILRDTASNATVAGANLSFSEQTKFGWLLLGSKMTGSDGKASILYLPVANGTRTIVISYDGNATYAASNATVTVNVFAAAAPPPPPVSADQLIIFVIVAVVGGVWVTYAFVAFQILGIRSIGSRPEDEAFESKEMEKMAKPESEPEDPGASRKRAPATSNANRAVVYLAISALVLSGVAVALLVMGGVGHTAAYTPMTVNLQLTVVPDFQGGGYDVFVPDEFTVHAGDTVHITIFNADTMDHGFAIDALGVSKVVPAASQDNVTGDITPTQTVVTFTVPNAGAFEWYCTNPCGPGHQYMTGTLLVLPDD